MQVYSNKNAMYVCTFLYVLISYQMKLMLLVTGHISNGDTYRMRKVFAMLL